MGRSSVEETRPTCSAAPTPNSMLACVSSVGIHPHPHTTSRPPLRNWTRAPSGLFAAWSADAEIPAESDALNRLRAIPFLGDRNTAISLIPFLTPPFGRPSFQARRLAKALKVTVTELVE